MAVQCAVRVPAGGDSPPGQGADGVRGAIPPNPVNPVEKTAECMALHCAVRVPASGNMAMVFILHTS
jgi:hypothetical protein